MELPDFYTHYCPTKILGGQMGLSNLPFEMQRLGASRAVLVTDPSWSDSLALARVKQAYLDAGAPFNLHLTDTRRPSTAQARELAEIFNATNGDCLIALGPAGAMHLAKAAAMLARQHDLQEKNDKTWPRLKRAILMALPTTFSEGYMVSNRCEISDGDACYCYHNDRFFADIVILDPVNTLKTSPQQVLYYGLDAFGLALQAYLHTLNPVVRIYAKAAIELIRKFLQPAVKNPSDRTAVAALANASLYAGIAASDNPNDILSALAESAAAVCNRRRGELMAALLPSVMDLEAGLNPGAMQELTGILGGCSAHLDEAAAAELPAELIQKICSDAGDLPTLTDLGLNETRLQAVAQLAMQSPLAAGANEDDLLTLLRQA